MSVNSLQVEAVNEPFDVQAGRPEEAKLDRRREVAVVGIQQAAEEECPRAPRDLPFQGPVAFALGRPAPIECPVLGEDIRPELAASTVRHHVPLVQGPFRAPCRRGVAALVGRIPRPASRPGESPGGDSPVSLHGARSAGLVKQECRHVLELQQHRVRNLRAVGGRPGLRQPLACSVRICPLSRPQVCRHPAVVNIRHQAHAANASSRRTRVQQQPTRWPASPERLRAYRRNVIAPESSRHTCRLRASGRRFSLTNPPLSGCLMQRTCSVSRNFCC